MINGPVFITGGPRTGTTLIASALMNCGFPGHGEGHFLSILKDLLDCSSSFFERHRAMPGTTLNEISPEHFNDALSGFLRSYINDFYGSRTWIEKSGEKTLYSALIFQATFPGSRFIWTQRRPIEIIQSRLRKFPQYGFEHHCEDLQKIMSAWLTIRGELKHMIEIDQYEIATDNGSVADRIAEFLNLNPWQKTAVLDNFKNTQPERTSDNYEPVSFAALPWTPEQQTLFKRYLHGVMMSYGYSYDEDYRLYATPPSYELAR